MEMHQIRYFLTVSETLNLAKAAERCNVAQPSLTRGIKTHEAVGELIRRERNLSHLTELGQRILPRLRQCYETAVSAKSWPRRCATKKWSRSHWRCGIRLGSSRSNQCCKSFLGRFPACS
jgi:DNA-binding transcriptional LysR family regulator